MSSLKFVEVFNLPLPSKFVAITTPWGICYHKVKLTLKLKRHEECHWEQYKKHGRFLFLLKYLWEALKHGYWDNKFEVEARKAENKK